MCEACGSAVHQPAQRAAGGHSHSHGHSQQHGGGSSNSTKTKFLRLGIATVSDRCSRGEAEDLSGPGLEDLARASCEDPSSVWAGVQVLRRLVPDDRIAIESMLLELCSQEVDVIVTTGGTGFAPRDVTPEATLAVIERQCPNLALRMAMVSFEKTPHAALSRAVCGIRGKTLIINVPGSARGAKECVEAVWPVLHHAVGLVRDDKAESLPTAHQHGSAGAPAAPPATASEAVTPTGGATATATAIAATEPENGSDGVIRRRSQWPMLPVPDALQLVLGAVGDSSVRPVEAVTVSSPAEAARSLMGRVLAEDVAAQDNLPPFRASIKDGFAVVAADGTGTFPCTKASMTAGDDPARGGIKSGVVTRIMTGAPLPDGADAVVMVENTEVRRSEGGDSETVTILKAVAAGTDIREIGSDIGVGDIVLQAGHRIGQAELGLLATVGAKTVQCVRPPKIGVVSTGNELQEAFGDQGGLSTGKIRDSNRVTLISALSQIDTSVTVVDLGVLEDSPDALKKGLAEAFDDSDCDIVLSSGGVSMGETDFMHGALKATGFHIEFGRVLMKPGKPCTFATRRNENTGRNQLAFALPGNPVSAFVCLHLFVAPAIRRFYGQPLPPTVPMRTAHDLRLDPERPEYHRAIAVPDERGFTATSTGAQRSSRLLSTRSANVLLLLPQASGVLPAGTLVDAVVIGPLV